LFLQLIELKDIDFQREPTTTRQANRGRPESNSHIPNLHDAQTQERLSKSCWRASCVSLGQAQPGPSRTLQTKGNVITRTQAYQVGDKTFATLEEAQTYEMQSLLNNCSVSGSVGSAEFWKSTAEFVVEQKDKVVDILTTGPRSKPKARKINKKNKPKEAAA